MTWNELEQKHAEIIQESLENAITHDFEIAAHSKTSVEYAIEVLEGLRKDIGSGLGREYAYQALSKKITELHNLIK